MSLCLLKVLPVLCFLVMRVSADLTCEAVLMLASGNRSLNSVDLSNQSDSNSSGVFCRTSIDGIGTCWPRSMAGEMVSRPCPELLYGVRYNTTNKIFRKCQTNGTWASKGNYSQCKAILSVQRKSKVHYRIAVIINYMGHCLSLFTLLIAFILFLRLRSIRCLRNIIHWNLISAFILRNATWFIVQLTMNPDVHESNVLWCRLVTTVYNYFHMANFFWMFGEGCYLHTAIVLTYSTDRLKKWMFICIGWCIPFPIIVAWAIGKLYYDNEKCWFGKRADKFHLPLQHCEDPHDQTQSLHHLRNHPVQEGSEGHPSAIASAGDYVHAVLCKPRRGRGFPNCLHLLQFFPSILSGLLCVRVLLFSEQ
ncbi:corticotropin-releasing factor receptor 1 isoform X2 [Colossoma macropomum]|uniref:corticotropin-releasing factor receptor 1 isoform X2 n=1 Tax=Colossoma macropomum TaxID=42526 RepID=UPI0018656929|nr:corticotropin-releasing factor receptor 1 isoform X2 [Colossoma macropomum]